MDEDGNMLCSFGVGQLIIDELFYLRLEDVKLIVTSSELMNLLRLLTDI